MAAIQHNSVLQAQLLGELVDLAAGHGFAVAQVDHAVLAADHGVVGEPEHVAVGAGEALRSGVVVGQQAQTAHRPADAGGKSCGADGPFYTKAAICQPVQNALRLVNVGMAGGTVHRLAVVDQNGAGLLQVAEAAAQAVFKAAAALGRVADGDVLADDHRLAVELYCQGEAVCFELDGQIYHGLRTDQAVGIRADDRLNRLD